MSESTPAGRVLDAWPCQSICVWLRTDEVIVVDEQSPAIVFRCSGCGSEWVRSEPWTPIDVDGVVPTDVAAEARRRTSRP